MNILFLTYAYRPDANKSGSDQRTQFLVRALRRLGDVYIFSLCYDKRQEEISSDGRFVTRCIEQRMSLLYVVNHYLLKIFHVIRWHPWGAERRIIESFPNVRFDCVVCRYTWLAGYCKPWKIAPVYIDIDDLPIEMFRTTMKGRWGVFGGLGDWLVRRWQMRVWRKSAGGWLANCDCLHQVGDTKCHWLPNLPPENKGGACRSDIARDSILTVASFAHTPNVEGVARFLEKVWPAFHARNPNVRYRLVGKSIPKRFGEIEGVDVVGFVEDLRSEYERCYCAVVPIYSGSGTCIKTLEAMTYGRIAFCSRFAARGVDVSLIGRGVEIVDSDKEMFLKLCSIIENHSAIWNVEKIAPKSVEAIYNLDMFSSCVERTIKP